MFRQTILTRVYMCLTIDSDIIIQQKMSFDNRSISSRTQSSEDSLSLGLDMAILKKFGKSPSGWYANIMFPFKVIDSLIFGATFE